MELKQEKLDKVLSENTQGMSKEEALKKLNLFIDKQLEALKKEKEKFQDFVENYSTKGEKPKSK